MTNLQSLLASLRNSILDENMSLIGLIRKAQVIARKLSLKQLEEWAICELDGYVNRDQVPDYRKVGSPLVASFSNGVYRVSNKHVPVSMIPSKIRDDIRYHRFDDGISTLQNFIASGEQAVIISVPDIIGSYYHKKVYEGYLCENIYKEIPMPYVVQVLDSIRDHLLRIILDIEDEYIPDEIEAHDVMIAR